VALAAVLPGLMPMSAPEARQVRYEHRVVVPTSGIDRDQFHAESLERNVNALAARGFELTALAGGDGALVDTMLTRGTAGRIVTEHAAITLAVMARPVAQAVVARTYRLLHVTERESVAQVIAPLGAQGFRLALAEHDGEIVHLAFEKTDGDAAVEYREFRNRGRASWMDQLLADPDVRARMTRVVPVALGAGIVELGASRPEPGHVQWLSKPTHAFETLTVPIRDLAKTGYRVDLVRRRGPNDLDVLLVKPAGVSTSPAVFDLDDGPWGSPCGRGTIAGAAVGPDGDVYCASDTSGTAPSNRGLDLTVRAQPSASGAVLFRGPTCDVLAGLSSARPASARLAFAAQLEQELASQVQPGFRVTRLLAAQDRNLQARLVAFTTNAAARVASGAPADRTPAPYFRAELDTPGDDLARQREAAINAALEARGLEAAPLWVELDGRRGRTARLLGCAPTRLDRETAESAARGALIGEGLGDYRLDSRVIVRRW
jgi:hypothetical protein